MSYDVTYCSAPCGNKKCEIHRSKAEDCIRARGFASLADRHAGCIRFRRKIKNENNINGEEQT